MDYPNSVPSAGLVDGKFVDENPITGAPGSLIPASWGIPDAFFFARGHPCGRRRGDAHPGREHR